MTNVNADNLKVWDKVKYTNPAYTKDFQVPGGFRGTSIVPMLRIQMATEFFGPCGLGWGYEILSHEFVSGFYHVHIRLWYKLDGEKGIVDAVASTVYEQKRANGPFFDEDAPKKALTDAIGNALTKLGFNADIHMGKFDDKHYLNWVGQRFAQEEAEKKAQRAQQAQAAAQPQQASTAPAPQAPSEAQELYVINDDVAGQAVDQGQPAAQAEGGQLSARARANTYKVKLRKVDQGQAQQLESQQYQSDDAAAFAFASALARALSAQLQAHRPDVRNGIITSHSGPDGRIGNLDSYIQALENGLRTPAAHGAA